MKQKIEFEGYVTDPSGNREYSHGEVTVDHYVPADRRDSVVVTRLEEAGFTKPHVRARGSRNT